MAPPSPPPKHLQFPLAGGRRSPDAGSVLNLAGRQWQGGGGGVFLGVRNVLALLFTFGRCPVQSAQTLSHSRDERVPASPPDLVLRAFAQ